MRSISLFIVAVSVLLWSQVGSLSVQNTVYATSYDGGGVATGIVEGQTLTNSSGDIRVFVTETVRDVLLLMGLAAVTVIIAAGITLVIGGVSDEKRELARKMIFWAVGGLVVILLASAVVQFVLTATGTG